jgi:hypothetical protein
MDFCYEHIQKTLCRQGSLSTFSETYFYFRKNKVTLDLLDHIYFRSVIDKLFG